MVTYGWAPASGYFGSTGSVSNVGSHRLMGNRFPAILSCASMSPVTALSGSAQFQAWRAGEMANSPDTLTLLAWLSVRFLRIATERFGSAAIRWRPLESYARSMGQRLTAMDRAAPFLRE